MSKDKPDDIDTSVRVALRIRPQSAAEKIEMCRVCTTVTPGHPQVVLGKDKAFTFDHVFDVETEQPLVYKNCVESLIEGCFDGYNATVLAYGQTGSGKTYTMGTGFDVIAASEAEGIIPRAVAHLFEGIDFRKSEAKLHNEPQPDFKIMAQFMELYNEDLIDLFDMDQKGKKSHAKIHEDVHGGIYTVGITMKTVQTAQETLKCLHQGAISRTTASTNMNAQSSRSHAIFTLHVKQQRVVRVTEDERRDEGSDSAFEYESLSAKFHFVDLAGSERLKRTGATGDRAKEGISINCGLLALGNVISALGDIHKIGSHVPYRDSKLTRLLQDSLGGNSRTVMIACVSPSDRDFMETLNTLKYANRARNIKNKVVVNQDKASKQIATLRAEIQALTTELLEYRQGKRLSGEGGDQVNDMHHENTMLRTENDKLRLRLKVLHQTMETQSKRISDLVSNQATAMLNGELEGGVEELIKGYVNEIEEMRNKLLESDAMAAMVMRRPRKSPSSPKGNILEMAKMDLMKQKRRAKKQDVATHEGSTEEGEASVEEGIEEEASHSESDENEDEEEEEEGDEEEDEDEDSSSSSSNDEESEEETLEEDIAELSAEISIKERLIEELELSQNRLNTMKDQYEEKLLILEKRIRETEVERDTVLKSINNMDLKAEEKTKKVREEYKKKLSNLEGEVKKLQKAKQEHSKLLKAKAANDQKLKRLQQEIGDMKKAKVRLMQQMKLDSQKSKMKEVVKDKEIAQLRKERRKYAMHIRDLTTKNQQKDMILKRKQEEVNVLRRQNKPISGKYGKQKESQAPAPVIAMHTETTVSMTQTHTQSTQTATDSVQAHLVSVTMQSVATSPGPPPKEAWPAPEQRSVSIGDTPKVERPSSGGTTTPRSSVTSPSSKIPSPQKSPKTPGKRKTGAEHSARIAKRMWDSIEKKVSAIIARKQTIASMASDMERWMVDRDRLSRQLEKCQWKRDEAAKLGKDDNSIKELDEQLEALNAHLDYCQENISDNQNSIVEMEEESDSVDMSSIVAGCTLPESRILLEYFLSKTINMGQELSNRDILIKEYHNKVEALKENSELQNDLLQHALQQREEDYYGANYHGNDEQSPREGEVVPKIAQQDQNSDAQISVTDTSSLSDEHTRKKLKIRRRTGTPDEFVHPSKVSREPVIRSMNTSTQALIPLVPASANQKTVQGKTVSAELVQKLMEIEEQRKRQRLDDGTAPTTITLTIPTKGPLPGKNVSSVTVNRSQSLNIHETVIASTGTMSTSFKRGTQKSRSARSLGYTKGQSVSASALPPSRSQPSSANSSPAMSRKQFGEPEKTRHGSITDAEKIEDVFSRLTMNLPQEVDPDRGKMLPIKMPTGKPGPLFCAYGASGHNSAVLSLDVTDDMMFTGSKDRTVKVWDLNTCEEVSSFSGHKRDVMVVRYCPVSKLIFSVSQNVIKIWDMRESGSKPIRSLSPCNTLSQLSTFISSMAADSQITDMAVNKDGTCLYSALGNSVRVWDLRTYNTVCKLGGHVGPVQCLLLEENVNTVVYTGSRDHYIKVFDIGKSPTGVQGSSFTFEPPHYDGVQCLAMKNNDLFSGSRDNSIKKWSTYKMELNQHMISAHKDWVCAMAFLDTATSSVLLSGCRGGMLKLWKQDTTEVIGEIKAHRHPINAIATNSTCVFTASSDRLVRVWRPTNTLNEMLSDMNRSVQV